MTRDVTDLKQVNYIQTKDKTITDVILQRRIQVKGIEQLCYLKVKEKVINVTSIF